MASWFSKSDSPAADQQDHESEPALSLEEQTPAPFEEAPLKESAELIVSDEPPKANDSLALLSQAHTAIAEARSLDELKGIRDKAEAARKYAQAAGMGLEIQNYAAEVKLRAERRAGSLLAKLNLHGGDRRSETAQERLTLEEIGVSKDQSSRWQLTASVPEKKFENYVEQTRTESGEVTTAGLVRIARELKAKSRKRSAGATEVINDFTLFSSVEELSTCGRKFACIYIDAPWPGGREANTQFLSALAELPIELLAEDNAHMHLWANNDSLFAAKQALEQWGFQFSGCLLCLSSMGRPGEHWVEAHEFLLLGVRGELPLMERRLNSWMRAERTPEGFASERVRRIVERVSPGAYLELFGKVPASGWSMYSTTLGIDASVSELEGGSNE